MPTDDPLDLDSARKRQDESADRPAPTRDHPVGLPAIWESDVVPAYAQQSWQTAMAWERLPETTTLAQLERAGYVAPAPDDLDDTQLSKELARLLEKLGQLRVFFTKTNHLSDRELYEHLWHEVLRETVKDLPANGNYFHHIDLLGDCNEDNIDLYFRFYADEKERRVWQKQFPDYSLPDHQDPPYDRDRTLPRRPRR